MVSVSGEHAGGGRISCVHIFVGFGSKFQFLLFTLVSHTI